MCPKPTDPQPPSPNGPQPKFPPPPPYFRILIYTNATICEGLEVELQDVKLQGVVSEASWLMSEEEV